MATLRRAVAVVQVHRVAVLVAEHLDLDVPRVLQELLDVDGAVAERGRGLLAGGGRGWPTQVISLWAIRMPRPPPPAAALTMTG